MKGGISGERIQEVVLVERVCKGCTMEIMRIRNVIAMGMVMIVCQGCLGSLIKALVAPESLAISNASNAINQGVTSIENAGRANSSAADIERILANHPDAANSEELRTLSAELGKLQQPETTARKGGIPPRPSEFDRRVHTPTINTMLFSQKAGEISFLSTNHSGNTLLVEQDTINDFAYETKRRESKPFSANRTSSIAPKREASYQYGNMQEPRPLRDQHHITQ